jgi:hypothetical protein
VIARVAELVYAHDLKSCLARDVGSTPTSGTGSHLKIIAPIAQLVEQIPLKDKVVGSIPTGRTLRLMIESIVRASGGIGIRVSLRN